MVVLCLEANGNRLLSVDIRYCWYAKLQGTCMSVWPARVLSQQSTTFCSTMHCPSCSPSQEEEGEEGAGGPTCKNNKGKTSKNQKDDLNLTLIILFTEMISSYTCLFTQFNEMMSLLTTCLSAIQVWMTASGFFLASAKGKKGFPLAWIGRLQTSGYVCGPSDW